MPLSVSPDEDVVSLSGIWVSVFVSAVPSYWSLVPALRELRPEVLPEVLPRREEPEERLLLLEDADLPALLRLAEAPLLEALRPLLEDLEADFLAAAFLGAAFLVAPLAAAFLGAAFLAAAFLGAAFLAAAFLGAAFFAAFLGAAFLAAPLDEAPLPEDEPLLEDEPLRPDDLDAPFFAALLAAGLPPAPLEADFLAAAFLVDFAIVNGFCFWVK